MPTRVAINVVGGDGPLPAVVAGAARTAAVRRDLHLVLCGPSDAVLAAIEASGESLTARLEIRDAPTVIGPDDDPQVAVRGRPGASIRVAVRALHDGEVDAVCSAGPLAATVAAGQFLLPRLPGLRRPAVAVPLQVEGQALVVVDAGAAESAPAGALVRFAELGVGVARRDGVGAPRVGVLAPLGAAGRVTAELAALFTAAEVPGFVGAVTAREALGGAVDVLATAGSQGRLIVDVVRALTGAATGHLGVLVGLDATVATLEPDVDVGVAAAAIAHVANLAASAAAAGSPPAGSSQERGTT